MKMGAHRAVFVVCILITLLPTASCYALNCSLMDACNTSQENITLAENKYAEFIYELSTRTQEKFRIEAKVCEADQFLTVCTCRWISGNSTTCKSPVNSSMCTADDSKMRFELLVRRTHSDVIWELLQQNSTPVMIKHSKLYIIYSPQITELAVNGQQVNETHLVDENQEVSISCSFVNGNPPVNIRLINEKGHGLSSTKYSEGPLTLSLGVFLCDDAWPTITCEAPGSELNRSVSILVRCVPRLTPKDGQTYYLSKVLEKGLAFRLRSYTDKISDCLMTKLGPEPVTKKVVCEVSGRIPELTLTVRFAANHGVGEGVWTFYIKSELGESSTNFTLISKPFQGANLLVQTMRMPSSISLTEGRYRHSYDLRLFGLHTLCRV